MMNVKRILTYGFAVVFATVIFACSEDENQNAKLEVRLTDAPGDYEEVNIDIQEVPGLKVLETYSNGIRVQ